jgi:cellulose synthase/poly-beta-1,6-N-acetylglucosamine synthase-like glycosyltransferase
MKNILVSVLVPAYNEEKYILKTLSHLEKAIDFAKKENISVEVVVCDNSSTDKTKTLVREHFPSTIIVSEEKRGTNNAKQKAFNASSGKFIACLDADCLAPKDWITCALSHFQKNSDSIALSGNYHYEHSSKLSQFFQDALANVLHFIFHTLFSCGGFMLGGNVWISREALEKINGFDTSITFYGDDIALAQKLSAIGKIIFLPKLIVVTSSRRFQKQGFLKTQLLYTLNYFWVILTKKPFTQTYNDETDTIR